MSEKDCCLAFSISPGIGPVKFKHLIKIFKTAEDIWNAEENELEEILGNKLNEKFQKFKKEFELEKYLKILKVKKVEFIGFTEKDYPEKLKKIPNPPIVLFIRGDRSLLNLKYKLVAIVGTRRITEYGKNVTDLFSTRLSESGIVVVSGLALGVDVRAHVSCLKNNGKTVAVLGNGVDLCFPIENQKVYDEILMKTGLIISEYFPGTSPTAGTFPARNRIVAGISDGILVTEGASDSGSLITANFGLEYGRKVFAVPGPITSSLSAAPLRLIEKGAKLVVSPEDIIRELGIKNYELSKNKKAFVGLSSEEKKVIELLENESLDFDEIVRRLKIDSSRVGTLLSMLEIKGLIRNSGGKFSVNT